MEPFKKRLSDQEKVFTPKKKLKLKALVVVCSKWYRIHENGERMNGCDNSSGDGAIRVKEVWELLIMGSR